MLKKILNTVFVRVANGIISFLIVIINSKNFGASGMGTIGLIILAISIFGMINGIVGGGAFVYFVPRINNFKLFVVSYSWAFISLFLFYSIAQFLNFVPQQFVLHTTILAFVFTLTNINKQLLAGNQRIIRHNFLSLLSTLLLISGLFIFTTILHQKEIFIYIITLYISYITTYILSLFSIVKHLKQVDFSDLFSVFLKVTKLGTITAVSGALQQLNYRLSYYFIESFLGLKALGRYTVGVQMSESTWLVGRSIAFIQYSRISNLTDLEKAKEITLFFLKVSFTLSAIIISVLSALPEEVYTFIFGKDFEGTQAIILSLAVGILALSVSFVFSHYFSGIGKPKYNAFASGFGLVVTAFAGFFVIPMHGIIGAGATASLSYLFITLFQFYLFMKYSKAKFVEFLPTKADFLNAKNILS